MRLRHAQLTLHADKQVIARAKQLAAARGISVSAMFSGHIEALTSDRTTTQKPLPSRESCAVWTRPMRALTDRQL